MQGNTWLNENCASRNNMHVMTQVLKEGDGPHLSHGLSVVNTYTKVIAGSK